MKRGGQVIYAGPLGRHSHKLIEYFEVSDYCFFAVIVLVPFATKPKCFAAKLALCSLSHQVASFKLVRVGPTDIFIML